MENNKKPTDNSGEQINTEGQTTVNELDENSEVEMTVSDDDKVIQLNNELNIQKDKYVRLFAEFDNFKRRNAKERIELIQTAGKDVITSML